MRIFASAPPVRRSLAASLAVLCLVVGGWTLTSAVAATPPDNTGLYGAGDPTYDGVFRQSLTLLGLHAAGRTPDPTAVNWLLTQQCKGGGFTSYNAAPAKGCAAYNSTTYTGGIDTNATSMALQALLATGHPADAAKAAKVLRDAQDDDGGWPFIVGGGSSDPNSTGLVLSALAAAGDAPNANGTAYLTGLQIGCGTVDSPTDAADRGGFSTPYSGGAPDVLATVQATPGLSGFSLAKPLPLKGAWVTGGPTLPCPAAGDPDVAGWAATWLSSQVTAGNVTGSNVGWAILSFAATRTHRDTAQTLYAGLGKASSKSSVGRRANGRLVVASVATNPGALGLQALAAQALGHHSAAIGFAKQAAATITLPAASPSPSATASASATATPSPSASASPTSSGPTLPQTGSDPYVVLGGFVLLGLGVALVRLGARR